MSLCCCWSIRFLRFPVWQKVHLTHVNRQKADATTITKTNAIKIYAVYCIRSDRIGWVYVCISRVSAMLDYLTLISRPFLIPFFYFSFYICSNLCHAGEHFFSDSLVYYCSKQCVCWQIVSSEIAEQRFDALATFFWTRYCGRTRAKPILVHINYFNNIFF